MRLAILAAVAAGAAAAAPPPNFVWILADDLNNDNSQDRLAIMPNLRRIARSGAHFVNHVAAQPVCGPSRSSLLQGRFPHNAGYLCNIDGPSEEAYLKVANNTVGTWLTSAGYHTAFVGKYINGLEGTVPSGWNYWSGFSSSAGTYNYYNSTPYNCSFARDGVTPTSPCTWTAMTGVHQADFVGQRGVAQMQKAVADGLPFFVHLTPLMVHEGTCFGPHKDPMQYSRLDTYWERNLTAWGCDPAAKGDCSYTVSPCPTEKNAHAFDGVTAPHVPSWNATASGPLPGAMDLAPVDAFVANRMDIGFRNRSVALLDLDDLIGVVLDGIEALGVMNSTYIIFTSDNGFHQGEHRMLFGKEHPYESDVSLPFYISGPGVPAGAVLEYPTTHIDITATVVELAGATVVGPALDGLSFAAAFSANPPAPADWRDFQFSEHHCGPLTWRKVRRPLAGTNATYNMWCDKTTEVFDLVADPWELKNTVDGEGAAFAAANGPLAEFLWTCAGAECNRPTAQPVKPFDCYVVSQARVDEWAIGE
jgi:hypothetical protein